MEKLFQLHKMLLQRQNLSYVRSLMETIPWDQRLVGIKGFRGVGKTTLLLQHIKQNYGTSDRALYISLDNIWFSENRLVDVAEQFVQYGGEHLYIDEIHKYPDWALELKNIYDQYPDLKITFTGSSLLQILDSRADLSRRALLFHMQGLSFREYLNMTLHTEFPVYDLDEILSEHTEIADLVLSKVKPLRYFDQYLREGYYPFFIEDREFYYQRLLEILDMIIDIEFPRLRGVDPNKTRKIKQLLYIIAHTSPFKPNITKLASRIGISRNTVYEYLRILADADLLKVLNRDTVGIGLLQKPEKIYPGNTNLAYALSLSGPDKGTLRETFFLVQLAESHKVTYTGVGDFMVDGKYLFEVGGKNKTLQQIKGIHNAWLAVDDTEYGHKNRIPLWLFGFLY